MKRASFVTVIFATALATAALTPVACTTGVAEDLFASSGDNGGDGGSTPSSSKSSATGGVPTSASSSTDDGVGPGGGGQGGAEPQSSASAGGNGAGGDGAGGDTTSSSSSGPAPIMIDCNGISCPADATNACCWHNQGDTSECVQGPADADNCNTAAQQGGFATRIECQLPEHCPEGTVCCGNRVPTQQGTYYESLTCQETCPSPDIVICGNEGEEGPVCPYVVPTNAPPYQSLCKTSMLLPPGFLVCGQP